MNKSVFFIAVLIMVIGHLLRLKRWSNLIYTYEHPKTDVMWSAMILGYGVDFIVPFHIGDIVRGIVTGKRLKNKYIFAFSTILIDRLLDVIFVAIIYLAAYFIYKQFLSMALVYSIFSIFLIVTILICIKSRRFLKIMILNFSSIFNEKIQLSVLKFAWSSICVIRKIIADINKCGILLNSVFMWSCYLLSYYLFAVSFHNSIYNISSIFNYFFGISSSSIFIQLILNKDNGSIGLVALYVSLTIFIMLFAWIAIKYLQRAEPNEHDKTIMPFKLDYEQLEFLKEYFVELKNNRYFHEFVANNNDVQILKNFSAGSNAITLLCRDDNCVFFRKYAFGEDADKLYEQVGWLLRHKENLPVTEVNHPIRTDVVCSYDMPFNPLCSDFFTYIHSTTTESSWGILKDVISSLERNYSVGAIIKKADKESMDLYVDKKIISNLGIIKHGSLTSLLYKPRHLLINGIKYKNLCYFEKYLLDKNFWEKIFKNDAYADIHGDLTIENIICCKEYENGYYLIDPNGGNIHNSPNLDYAKILQSLHGGYEFLMHTQSVNYTEDSITYEVISSSAYDKLYALFQEYLQTNFPQDRVRSIYFHEIVHWLRLMPYKIKKDGDRSPMFYARTVIIVNDIFNKFAEVLSDE